MARERFRFKALEVYQSALRFFGWSVTVVGRLPASRHYLGDQFARASLSIVLNIAEGSGLWRLGNKRKHYEYARGSTFEVAATLDALRAIGAVSEEEFDRWEAELAGIGAMLTRLVQRYERTPADHTRPAQGDGARGPPPWPPAPGP